MSDKLRSQVIRVAYNQQAGSELQRHLLKLAIEFNSPEALKEYQDTHDVRKTTELTVKSESGSEKTQHEDSHKSEHKMPKMTLKADRYTDGKVKFKGYPEYMSKEIRAAFGKVKPITGESVADMCGMPALTNLGTGYSVSTKDRDIEVEGPHIERMYRRLAVDGDGKPYIKNDVMILTKDAPKGLGTKIFAAQVAQAKEHGVSYIKCEAFRNRSDSSWVGYKVWPKLGYDGPIPLDGAQTDSGYPMSDFAERDFRRNMEPKIQAAGFKKPYQVSHLYHVDGGQDWWEEHGESFEATFDLSEDSHSMKILTAYLAEKAQKDNVSPEAWLSKMATDKKPEAPKPDTKKKDQHENIVLDESDHKALDAVWKRIREQHKK